MKTRSQTKGRPLQVLLKRCLRLTPVRLGIELGWSREDPFCRRPPRGCVIPNEGINGLTHDGRDRSI